MKNVLILHCSENNSSGNWYPYLKKVLEAKGYIVWSPNLPNAEYPDMDRWADTVYANEEWKFDTETVIIGHSSGATLILGLLERLPENLKIDKAILVAGYTEIGTLPQFFKYKMGILKKPFNWEKIKQSCNQFYFIHSDNDPYQCGEDQGRVLQKNLGGELIIKKGEGHFNLEKGPEYIEFPELLEYIG